MLSKIHSCACSLLARREHSKLELQKKLGSKGFSACDIAKVIDELAGQNLQNDSRFVESYVNMRRRKGFGPQRIQVELKERGIDKKQVATFLQVNDPAWLESAKVLRYKKFGKKIPCGLRERAEQKRYLYYKGFTSDQIKEIFGHEKDL